MNSANVSFFWAIQHKRTHFLHIIFKDNQQSTMASCVTVTGPEMADALPSFPRWHLPSHPFFSDCVTQPVGWFVCPRTHVRKIKKKEEKKLQEQSIRAYVGTYAWSYVSKSLIQEAFLKVWQVLAFGSGLCTIFLVVGYVITFNQRRRSTDEINFSVSGFSE